MTRTDPESVSSWDENIQGDKAAEDVNTLPGDMTPSNQSSKENSDNEKDPATYGARQSEVVNGVMKDYATINLFGWRIGTLKLALFIALFLQGYCTGLGGQISQSIQTYAANGFKSLPLVGSLNTVKSVVASAMAVPYARLSDRFGRIEIWIFACIIYTVGSIVAAATPTFGGLYAGVVLIQIGYSGFRFLATALTADLSGLRDRTFFMNIFLIPVIINTWVSGDIVDSLAGTKAPYKWRWGYGIFTIIVPVSTLMLVIPYIHGQYLAYRKGTLPPYRFRRPGQPWYKALWDLIEQSDLIGVTLFAAFLVLLLLPLTLAGGLESKWEKGYIIAMIVVGGCLGFIFLGWEFFVAKNPFVPRSYLGESTIYVALLMEFVWRFALSIELDYLVTVLMVGFGESKLSAQRISQLYNFLQSCTNIVVGIILHFYPRPKLFVFSGSLIGLLGMGLLYKYRTAYNGISGLIGAEICVGIGGGMIRYPMWTLVHSSTSHAQMATITGLLMSLYQVGDAVGSSVAAAIWTQRLAKELVKRLGETVGMQFYNSPLNYLTKYPLGSETRDLVLDAYSEIQRLLIIVAISFAAFNVVLTVFIRNYKVDKQQSYTEEERIERKNAPEQHSWVRRIVGY